MEEGFRECLAPMKPNHRSWDPFWSHLGAQMDPKIVPGTHFGLIWAPNWAQKLSKIGSDPPKGANNELGRLQGWLLPRAVADL